MTTESDMDARDLVDLADDEPSVDAPEGDELVALGASLLSVTENRGWTIATAESLTGGAVSSALVANAGSSKSFRGGVVTYATDTKADVLGVSRDLLAAGGPVQAEVAEQMAQNVIGLFGSNIGISTTGVAGPTDTDDGPAGLVYVGAAFASPTGEAVETRSRECHFLGDRNQVRRQAVAAALKCALRLVDGQPD